MWSGWQCPASLLCGLPALAPCALSTPAQAWPGWHGTADLAQERGKDHDNSGRRRGGPQTSRYGGAGDTPQRSPRPRFWHHYHPHASVAGLRVRHQPGAIACDERERYKLAVADPTPMTAAELAWAAEITH